MLLGAACALLLGSLPAHAIITSDTRPDTQQPIVINQLVGAERFYGAGYFGFNTVIANVEAGHIWEGHEAFAGRPTVSGNIIYVNDPSIEPPIGQSRQYDGHATAVGFTLAGLGPLQDGVGYYYYQLGMAPGATLVSAAIATDWVGNTGEFNISSQSFTYAYVKTMQTGVQVDLFFPGSGITVTRTADVVNSSWGFEDNPGIAYETMAIDALAFANHNTVVLAAGNHDDPPSPQVIGPASGYNSISVAALAGDLSTPAYGTVAEFSNVGPNDFHNPKPGSPLTPGARAAVDIAAPGQDLVLAAYTGTTGSNTGGTDAFPGQNNLYYVGAAGTSFASPIVAGGAALVVDAGYAKLGGGRAVDGRVIKAVLLNSADKTAGWNNGASVVNGVYRTTQSLDYSVGAGALNLNRAYDQFLSGTTDVPGLSGGTIHDLGWDFGKVIKGAPNDYLIDRPLMAGEKFAATLDWFIMRTLDDVSQTASEGYFDDLDLQVWKVDDGILDQLVAESASAYNNVEHVWFDVPQDGDYAIRILWYANNFDLTDRTELGDEYAVAWAVPEPASGLLLLISACVLIRRRKHVG